MKTITNEKFIQRRVQLARRTSLIGMGVLIAGLVASFNQQYYYLSLPALVIGFILANVSAYNANRYLKEPRPDQALTKALRGFDNNYRLFNYCAPIAHVLLTPSRLYTLTVKLQDGRIRRQNNRWQPLPGFARDIASGGGRVYVVGGDPVPGGFGIYEWNEAGTRFDPVTLVNGGGGIALASNQKGAVYVITSNGEVNFTAPVLH